MIRKDQKDKQLTRIANHLIMNASYITDLGLYHGKMGIILFFAHYYRYTGDAIYDEFAEYLLNEITEDIHRDTPLHFEWGLSGIGWGVEYLIDNGFGEDDTGDVLSEIDHKVMEKNLLSISDCSIQTGVEGLVYYIDKRLKHSGNKNAKNAFTKSFLKDYEHIKKKHKIKVPEEKVIISSIYDKMPEGNDVTEWRYGLEKGCAGYGLKQILYEPK